MSIPSSELAACIRLAREGKNLTQTELGKLVGMPQSQISRLETNPGSVTARTLQKLAKALGIHFASIYNSLPFPQGNKARLIEAFNDVRTGHARIGIAPTGKEASLCYIRLGATGECIYFPACDIPEDIHQLIVKELTAGMSSTQKDKFVANIMNTGLHKEQEKSMELEGCVFSTESGLPFNFLNPPDCAIVFGIKSEAVLKFHADGSHKMHKAFKLVSNAASLLPSGRDEYEYYGLPIAILCPYAVSPNPPVASAEVNGSSSNIAVEAPSSERLDPTDPDNWQILIADVHELDRRLLQKTIVQLWNFHCSLSVQIESHLLNLHS